MKSLTTAWLFAIGLYTYDHVAHTVSYDSTTANGATNKPIMAPPQPRNLFLGSLLFAALGFLGDVSPNASKVSNVFAWGIDFAYFMKVASSDANFNQQKAAGKNTAWQRTPIYSGGPWPPPTAPNTEILPSRTGTSTDPYATTASNPSQTSSSPTGVLNA